MNPPKPSRGPRAIWPTIDGAPASGADDEPVVDDPVALSDPFRELRGGRRSVVDVPDPTGDPVFHPGAVINGRYRVERLLGEGGMAKVYRAVHLSLGEPVALKVLSPDLSSDKDVVARFLREARLMAALRNPHIVRVHDFGEAQAGRPYFAMELLKGKSLDVEIADRGVFPVGRATRLISEACEALIDVHDAGLVHRDVKPENLFIEERRGRLHVKLLDFGVTKVIAPTSDLDVKATQGLVGTPLYMSPEQVHGAKLDARSDVWALGVVLYELVVGETPFEANALLDILQRVLTAAPIPASERDARVPRALDAVILKCLAKEPADRFASVVELRDALAPFASQGAASPSLERVSVTPERRASALDQLEKQMRETRPTGEKRSTSPLAVTGTLQQRSTPPRSSAGPAVASRTMPSSTSPIDVTLAASLRPRTRSRRLPLLVVAGILAVGAIATYALLRAPTKTAAPPSPEEPAPRGSSVSVSARPIEGSSSPTSTALAPSSRLEPGVAPPTEGAPSVSASSVAAPIVPPRPSAPRPGSRFDPSDVQ